VQAAIDHELLTIIVPVYNEARTVRAVLDRLVAIEFSIPREIIVVDDGSSDGTAAILAEAEQAGLPITVLRAPVNRGKGHAIRMGIGHARGSIVAIQDADLELDPHQLVDLVRPIVARDTDVVYGSRFLEGRPAAPLASIAANRFLTGATNVLFGAAITDMETCYKLMRVEVARSLGLQANRFDIEPEITAKLLLGGHRIHELPVTFQPRSRAQGKKIGWRDGIRALQVLSTLRWRGDREGGPRLSHLMLLIAVASLLRVMLVAQGGQLYWPDERLYRAVVELWDLPRWSDLLRGVLGTQDHLGFAVMALVPAGMHHLLIRVMHLSSDNLFGFPALLLSQMSVLSIALVYAIARRSGGDRREALTAAALMAGATTMLYYARHLLPYDSAMTCALAALWVGTNTESRPRTIACGALSAFAFIIYNGYWLIVGVVLLTHLVAVSASRAAWIRRAAWLATGFLGFGVVLMLLQWLAGAPLLVSGMRHLAGTVSDGYPPEGFTLSWEYLWHAEHGLLLMWLAAALVILIDSRPWTNGRRRAALLWLGGAAAIYLGLSASSAIAQLFVVMGRQSRQMVPFLCLAAAPAVWHALESTRAKRAWVAIGIAALTLQSAYNMSEPVRQRFPRELEEEIGHRYNLVNHAMSVMGPTPQYAPIESRWVLVNAQHLYPPRGPARVPAGVTVLQFPHPLEFLPYQYEGFEPLERQVLRRNDISMRLIDTAGDETTRGNSQ
jgi:hypothetical protein